MTPIHPAADQQRPALDEAAILAALPLTAMVFDASGTITWANARVEALVHPDRASGGPSSVVGTNVIDLVHPDDRAFAVELLTFGIGLPSRLLGPVRLRYVTATGRARYTDFWAQNHLDNPNIGGYVVQLTEETTQHRLAEAVTDIAEGAPLETVFEAVAQAMEGYPMEAAGAVLRRDRDGTVTSVSRSAVPVPQSADGVGPWQTCFSSGADADHNSLDDLPPEVADAARAKGFASVWCRSVPQVGPDAFMLACWRTEAGAPSPNQRHHLRQAVGVLGLGITQDLQRRQLEQMAYTDSLTGLANRAHLYEVRSQQRLDGTAVLFIDLDGFKQVNDVCGHEAGDHLLRHVASVLRRNTRHNDEVVRLGGDEFVVLCPPPTQPADLSALAERIIAQIGEPFRLGRDSVTVGASVGIVHFDHHEDLDALLRDADAALYLAKAKGRSRWWMAPRE